jgi:hypothetical protein
MRGSEPNLFDGLPCLTDQTALAELYLRRLKRALLLRFYTETFLSPGDRRLLDRVILSCLRDCQDVQVTTEARRLISDARGGVGLFRRPPARERDELPWSI